MEMMPHMFDFLGSRDGAFGGRQGFQVEKHKLETA
jgi:hypothetical protein